MKSGVTIKAWLSLLRAPNLWTVPGDPLVGALLAGWTPQSSLDSWKAVPAALLLYASGVILNDVADVRVDRLERPERPLPSGAISVSKAVAAGSGLLICGVLFAAWAGLRAAVAAGSLAGAILLYNFWLKRLAGWGALSMGVCRGGSVLLGAAAFAPLSAWPLSVWAAALAMTIYVAGISLVARHEVEGASRVEFAFIPLLSWIAGSMCAWMLARPLLFLPLLLHYPVIREDIKFTRRWIGAEDAAARSKAVGGWLGTLTLAQAFLASLAGGRPGWLVAAGLLLLWPFHRWARQRVPAS